MIAIHLKATNDINGNPRRAFLVLDTNGETRAIINEGYSGRGALAMWSSARRCPVFDGGSIEITVAEYNRLKRDEQWIG